MLKKPTSCESATIQYFKHSKAKAKEKKNYTYKKRVNIKINAILSIKHSLLNKLWLYVEKTSNNSPTGILNYAFFISFRHIKKKKQ